MNRETCTQQISIEHGHLLVDLPNAFHFEAGKVVTKARDLILRENREVLLVLVQIVRIADRKTTGNTIQNFRAEHARRVSALHRNIDLLLSCRNRIRQRSFHRLVAGVVKDRIIRRHIVRIDLQRLLHFHGRFQRRLIVIVHVHGSIAIPFSADRNTRTRIFVVHPGPRNLLQVHFPINRRDLIRLILLHVRIIDPFERIQDLFQLLIGQ